MNITPHPTRRCFRTLLSAIALSAAGFAATSAFANPVSNKMTPFAMPAAPAPKAPVSFTLSEDFRLPMYAPELFLSAKGKVAAELPWAVRMPDPVFHFLFGATKTPAAEFRHAQKTEVRKVKRIHDQIDLVGLTDPRQARLYRAELHRALAAAR